VVTWFKYKPEILQKYKPEILQKYKPEILQKYKPEILQKYKPEILQKYFTLFNHCIKMTISFLICVFHALSV